MTGKNNHAKKANKKQNQSIEVLIAPELLHLDIDKLVDKLIEIHPEPFAVLSEKEFLKQAEIIKQSIRFPLTRGEFYLRVAPLVADLVDIHTSIELPKKLQKDLNQANSDNDKLFPLAVLYEENNLFVAADLSAMPSVPTGSIISAINGAPIEFLLQVMRSLTVKETDAGHRRRIQVDFPWLLAVMGYASHQYQIDYRWQGREVSVTLDGIIPPNSINTNSSEQTIDDNAVDSNNSDKVVQEKQVISQSKSVKSFYGFSQLTDNTAMLWFNDFNEDPKIFKSFVNQQFSSMARKGLSNLIIDVRYNDGGLSQNIKALLGKISSEDIYWSQRGEIKISRPLIKLHKKKTKQRRKNKYQWGLQWLPLEWTDSLQYKISWTEKGEIIPVSFDPIEGRKKESLKKIIVLTNGFCYSACSSFVATVNHYSLAETMGEITGSFAKVQYGYPIKVKLPHSQLSLILPTMKLMFQASERGRADSMDENKSLVMPQVPINRNVQHIIERQDFLSNSALLRAESSQ